MAPAPAPRVGAVADEAFSGYDAVLLVDEARESQFDALLAHLRRDPAPPPSAVALALTGQKFHGHRGRPWTALRGNLHLSACFPVGRALGPAAVALTALPAVAVLERARPWTGARFAPGIKWVNDILVDRHKISGVLTATQMKGPVTQSVVFGIGLNARAAPSVAPTVFVPRAGCLADALGPPPRRWARSSPPWRARWPRGCGNFSNTVPVPRSRPTGGVPCSRAGRCGSRRNPLWTRWTTCAAPRRPVAAWWSALPTTSP